MKKTLLNFFIFLCAIYIVNCTTTILVSNKVIEANSLQIGTPDEIYITCTDSLKYHFSNDTYYYFRNNILYTKGYSQLYDSTQGEKDILKKFEGIIPKEEIKLIEEIGTNKIKVLTTNGEEYIFENDGYYFIDGDTLFGYGKMYLNEEIKYFNGKIALVNIAYVQTGLTSIRKHISKLDEPTPIRDYEIDNDDYRDTNEGADVTLILNYDVEISGELLLVQDNLLLIGKDNFEPYDSTNVIEVNKEHIGKIIIRGENNFWEYAGYGALIGAGTGALIGYKTADDDDEFSATAGGKATEGAVCVGLMGAVIGGIVGYSSSTDEVVIKLPHGYNYSRINSILGTSLNSILIQLSRYPETEPNYEMDIRYD